MLDAVQTEIATKLKQLEGKKSSLDYADNLADWQMTMKLSPSLFEQEFSLPSLPDERVSYKEINDALRCSEVNQEVERLDTPLVPKGKTLEIQVESLLPKCVAKSLSKKAQKQEYMMEKREALVYFLKRVILDSMPSQKDWAIIPTGLDSLSASLFTLHFISQAGNTQIPWLALIWKYEIERYRNELLHDLLGSLSHEITVQEVYEKIERASNHIKEDLGARDPIVGWAHEWLNRLREFKSTLKLVECEVREKIEVDKSEDDEDEETDDKKKERTTDLRRKLREDVLKRMDPSSGGVQTPQTPLPRSIWAQTSITADSPLSYLSEELLSSLRAELNALRVEKLMKTCEYLAEIEKSGKPTVKEIADASKVGVRSTQTHTIGLTLTERYIPSLMNMGLRYRYIFTRMQKSALDSPGLAERTTISESDLYQIATKHLEPSTSKGPQVSDLPDDCFQTTVETDLVSIRMDLFDREQGDWSEEPWTSSSSVRTNQWLYRKTPLQVENHSMPTQREIDLLSILSSINADSKGIKWILKSLKFPSRTAEHLLSQLLRSNKLRVIYHPSLEYAGLPEGIILAAQFRTVKRLDEFSEWLASSFPYVHAQFSRTEKSMVARVRVPRFSKSDSQIGQELKKDLKAIGTIARNRTYQMSAFHRLYQAKNKPWRDPWQIS
jgi:hypothetical protein